MMNSVQVLSVPRSGVPKGAGLKTDGAVTDGSVPASDDFAVVLGEPLADASDNPLGSAILTALIAGSEQTDPATAKATPGLRTAQIRGNPHHRLQHAAVEAVTADPAIVPDPLVDAIALSQANPLPTTSAAIPESPAELPLAEMVPTPPPPITAPESPLTPRFGRAKLAQVQGRVLTWGKGTTTPLADPAQKPVSQASDKVQNSARQSTVPVLAAQSPAPPLTPQGIAPISQPQSILPVPATHSALTETTRRADHPLAASLYEPAAGEGTSAPKSDTISTALPGQKQPVSNSPTPVGRTPAKTDQSTNAATDLPSLRATDQPANRHSSQPSVHLTNRFADFPADCAPAPSSLTAPVSALTPPTAADSDAKALATHPMSTSAASIPLRHTTPLVTEPAPTATKAASVQPARPSDPFVKQVLPANQTSPTTAPAPSAPSHPSDPLAESSGTPAAATPRNPALPPLFPQPSNAEPIPPKAQPLSTTYVDQTAIAAQPPQMAVTDSPIHPASRPQVAARSPVMPSPLTASHGILTPAQALSRFQHMLENDSFPQTMQAQSALPAATLPAATPPFEVTPRFSPIILPVPAGAAGPAILKRFAATPLPNATPLPASAQPTPATPLPALTPQQATPPSEAVPLPAAASIVLPLAALFRVAERAPVAVDMPLSPTISTAKDLPAVVQAPPKQPQVSAPQSPQSSAEDSSIAKSSLANLTRQDRTLAAVSLAESLQTDAPLQPNGTRPVAVSASSSLPSQEVQNSRGPRATVSKDSKPFRSPPAAPQTPPTTPDLAAAPAPNAGRIPPAAAKRHDPEPVVQTKPDAAAPQTPLAGPTPQANPPQSAPQPLPVLQMQPLAATAAHAGAAVLPDNTRHALPKDFSVTLARCVSGSGHTRAELILEPPELGRMRFDLVTQGDRVQITLAAERPETLNLLRRHAEELRQEFHASGLDTGTLNFSQWGQQGQDAPSPHPPIDAPTDDTRPLATPPSALLAPQSRATGSGLDLRL